MNFTYAVGRNPVNRHWREVRLTTRPFPSRAEYAAIPQSHITTFLYRGPWLCAPPLAVDLGAIVFSAPAAGRLSSFVCQSQNHSHTSLDKFHRICGVPIVAFTKTDSTEHVFYVEASLSLVTLEEKIATLGRGLLEQAGDWIIGGWWLSPMLPGQPLISSSGKKEKETSLVRRIRS